MTKKTYEKLTTFSLALLMLAALAVGVTIYAHAPTTKGVETYEQGNPSCGQFAEIDIFQEVKATSPVAGFSGVYCLNAAGMSIATTTPALDCRPADQGGTPRVWLDHYEASFTGPPASSGWFLDWWQTNPSWTIFSVLVKGGSGEKTGPGPAPTGGYLYDYTAEPGGGIPGSVFPPTAPAPGFPSASTPSRPPDDAGLHAATAGRSGKFASVSHASFCGFRNDTDFQGCTLGYWGATQGSTGAVIHQAAWDQTSYTTSTTVGSVFGACVPGANTNDTLLTALGYSGGSGIDDKRRLLIKQAVASLLNADHACVNFPLTVPELLFGNLGTGGNWPGVNVLLCSSNANDIAGAAQTLNGYNNLGCPLDNTGGVCP